MYPGLYPAPIGGVPREGLLLARRGDVTRDRKRSGAEFHSYRRRVASAIARATRASSRVVEFAHRRLRSLVRALKGQRRLRER